MTGPEPTIDSRSAGRRTGDAIRAALRLIRPEERILAAMWLVGLLACVLTDTGLQLEWVFTSYVAYFGRYFIYLFLLTRLLFWIGDVWQPRRPWPARLYAWVFGGPPDTAAAAPAGGRPGRLLDRLLGRPVGGAGARPGGALVDREFARGAFLLFANLTVYTNIKVRIPFISSAVGDDAFRAMDEAIFGADLIRAIEDWFRTSPAVVEYFGDIYMHGYIWFVILVLILYVRRDRFALRWAFATMCVVYLFFILVTVAYPSYGPCFLERERFEYLRSSQIGVTQQNLFMYYSRSVDEVNAGLPIHAWPFFGIAAFPSLHVAHMVIIGVIALRTVPIYALWMLWITIATFIATIGFGWHYAVDGLGGVALAAAFAEGLYRLMRKGEAAGYPAGAAASTT